MLNNEADACTVVQLSGPAARTSSQGSGWVDVRQWEGDLLVVQQVGAVTGTSPAMFTNVRTATDNSGTGARTVASFAGVTAGTNIQKVTVPIRECDGFVQVDMTITGTTPSFTVSQTLIGRPKTV